MNIVLIRACAGLSLTALAACAAPFDPAVENTITVYVPEAAGVPAHLERIEVPDQTWRRAAAPVQAAPSSGPDEIQRSARTVAGDAPAVFRRLVQALASGASSYAGVLPRLGPPPPVDSPAPYTNVTFAARRCSAAEGLARLPEVRDRVCPTGSGVYTSLDLPMDSASEIMTVRNDLAVIGYRALGSMPPDLSLHPPRPDTFSTFARGADDPVIVVNHLREGPPREASVMKVSLFWPGGPSR